jgi:hypothetical protein
MPNATLIYYTGTGNTARATHLLRAELRNEGYEIGMIRVRRDTPPPSSCGDLLIVLFPVFAFTIPQSLRLFLRKLPNGNGTRAAIIANHGMLSTVATGQESQSPLVIKRILTKKKYEVSYIDAVGYPDSFTIVGSTISEKDKAAVLKAGDAKVGEIAKNIASDVKFTRTYGFWNRLGGWLAGAFFTWLGRWHFGKLYVADSSCKGCGICADGCSARTIRMVRGRPEWGYRCDGCLFCFNACPAGSVQVSIARLVLLTIAEIVPIVFVALYGWTIAKSLLGADIASYIAGNSLLSFACGLSMFGILVVPTIYLADKLIAICERIRLFSPAMNLSYTRNIKRYVCPGFKPRESLRDKIEPGNALK